MFGRDPLADAEPLIRRVYAYVAYRLGDGPDAEDVTSDVFELATRYRSSYDSGKGEPVAWLLGIARRRVAFSLANRPEPATDVEDQQAPGELEAEALDRLELKRRSRASPSGIRSCWRSAMEPISARATSQTCST